MPVADALPAGTDGLVWIGSCEGSDSTFQAMVSPFIGNPELFGFYVVDEPNRRHVSQPTSRPRTIGFTPTFLEPERSRSSRTSAAESEPTFPAWTRRRTPTSI